MCGGSDHAPASQPTASETYAAPDLKNVYKSFRDTGQVPYSYYGQGAPTNADELARVRAAYPGSFTPNTPPAPAPGGAQPHLGGWQRLMQVLQGIGSAGGPMGMTMSAIRDRRAGGAGGPVGGGV